MNTHIIRDHSQQELRPVERKVVCKVFLILVKRAPDQSSNHNELNLKSGWCFTKLRKTLRTTLRMTGLSSSAE